MADEPELTPSELATRAARAERERDVQKGATLARRKRLMMLAFGLMGLGRLLMWFVQHRPRHH